MIASNPVSRTRRHILLNLTILYGSGIITSLISLVPITFVPRYLDAVGIGKLTIAGSFTGIFAALILLGTSTFIVREGARDRERLAELLSNGIVLRVGIGLVLVPVVVTLLYILNYPAETRVIVLMLYGSLIISMVSQAFAEALQALENMRWRSATAILTKLVVAALGWLVLWRGGGLQGYVLVLILANVVELAAHGAYFILVQPFKPVVSRRAIMQVLSGGLPFFLWAFLQTIYAQTSSLMLSKLGGEEAVGWFGVAMQFVTPTFMIPSVVITVLLPQFSQLHLLGRDALRRSLERSISYMTIITVPLACGLAATADRVIDLFNYPATFQHSIPVLRVLAFLLPGTSLLMVAATAVAAMNKERAWARISLFSLMVAIVCNAGLIPLGQQILANPAVGAAVAVLSVELLTFAWAIRILGADMFGRQVFITFGKTMVLGLTMVVIVLALQSLPLALVIFIGGLVYISGLLLLKVVPDDDLKVARDIALRRWQVIISVLGKR